ncbi:MAG: ABC transporter substrate-binding protein [Deltaproteobacteria bacterium]|nr:ABC transporter substrate-binding protein [Deltaproteobacteria bacterium]
MRIVSLTCSNTEIVCALGLADRLVGVDDHSDFPEEVVADLPRVGPDLSIDVDAVAALRPDLVLASLTVPGHERIVAALVARGLPFVAPEPVSLDDVYRDIRDIGNALGADRAAEEEVARMQAAMPPVHLDRRPTVLVEWWPKPVIVPGRQSWVTDLIHLAGGRNPLAERDVKSTPVTDDEVVALAPDAVVISWCGVPLHRYRRDVVSRRAAWAGVPAVRNERIVPITEAFLGRPGPRLVEGYRALRAVVADASGAD